jgi:hypothetical protein
MLLVNFSKSWMKMATELEQAQQSLEENRPASETAPERPQEHTESKPAQ